MNSHLHGHSTRPDLYIQTQFSSEEESENLGHFQFQPKDVISEASSYEMLDARQPHTQYPVRATSNTRKLIVAGIVQLDFTVNSWKINAAFDAFDLIKQLRTRPLQSCRFDRPRSKELQHVKSVANLRNSNSILNRNHQRRNSGSSQRDLERAEVLNGIITKLNSREKSSKGKSQAKSQTKSLTQSHKSVEKKLVMKQKLKKLENILKDYKLEHEQSTQKSTVYYTKHFNKTKKEEKKKDLEDSDLLEVSNKEIKETKMGTFKKLKNEIMHVKNEVNELKQINEMYRRENHMLRSTRNMEENGRTSKQSYYSSDRDREVRQPVVNTNSTVNTNHQQPVSYPTQISSNFPTTYPLNYPNTFFYPVPFHPIPVPPPTTQPQQQLPNFPQSYSPIMPTINPYQNYSSLHPQPTSSYRTERCCDARHENYWKTMVPDNVHLIESSNAREPIVFCIKCRCQCVEKTERLNVTRKDYATSSVNKFKDLF